MSPKRNTSFGMLMRLPRFLETSPMPSPDILRAEMFAFQRRRRSQSLTRPLALSSRLPL